VSRTYSPFQTGDIFNDLDSSTFYSATIYAIDVNGIKSTVFNLGFSTGGDTPKTNPTVLGPSNLNCVQVTGKPSVKLTWSYQSEIPSFITVNAQCVFNGKRLQNRKRTFVVNSSSQTSIQLDGLFGLGIKGPTNLSCTCGLVSKYSKQNPLVNYSIDDLSNTWTAAVKKVTKKKK